MKDIQLTSSQQQVLHILKAENKAMTAYDLLDKVKPFGLNAPVQIYRILEKLMESGLVLKLNTVNKYFAHTLKEEHYSVCTICTECQKVDVIDVPQLEGIFHRSISPQQFILKNHYIEVMGACVYHHNPHH